MQHPENNNDYKGLTVNSGVAQPPMVNPYLHNHMRRKPMPTVSELVEGILKGDVTTLFPRGHPGRELQSLTPVCRSGSHRKMSPLIPANHAASA